MKKEDLYTRKRANMGRRFPLFDPITGKEEGWLHVLGSDSDAFRAAKAESFRRMVEIYDEHGPNKADALKAIEAGEEEGKLNLIASLVTAWSLDEPCTREAVVELLREAPQIRDKVDEVATKRALFFESASTNSPPSPKPSADSTSDPKEVKPAPDNT